MAEELGATPPDWPPLLPWDRLELEVRALRVFHEQLQHDVTELAARVAELLRARARDED